LLPNAILQGVPRAALGLLRAVFGGGIDGFVRSIIPAAKIMFEPLRMNPDGTSVDPNVSFKKYPTNLAKTEDHNGSLGLGNKYAETYGWDHVYVFEFDWRLDIFDSAKQLDTLIQTAKRECGTKKVRLAALSMGASVANAYLGGIATKNAFVDLDSVVYLSPAWQGVSTAAAIFNGSLTVNFPAVRELLLQNMTENEKISADLKPFLEGFLPFLLNGLDVVGTNTFTEAFAESVMKIYMRDLVSHWFGLWSLIPYENYDEARALCFPNGATGSSKAMVESLDKYHAVQGNMPKTIQAMQKKGVGFAIISLYGRPFVLPFTPKSYTALSDGTIDTIYTGGFPRLASAAPNAEPLTAQKKKDGHNHLSADGMVDASVCLFPENTWFVRGQEHSSYHNNEGPSLLAFWLVEGGSKQDVRANAAYPQFTVYVPGSPKLTSNMS
jgi:hypothetical protein